MINEVVRQRTLKAKGAAAKGEPAPEYNDAISWTLNVPRGNPLEPADVQLALAMAALFRTAETFRQILLDIA